MTVNQWLTIVSDLDHTTDPCLDYYRCCGFLAFVFLCPLLCVHGVTKSTQFIAPQLCNCEPLNDAVLDKVFEN